MIGIDCTDVLVSTVDATLTLPLVDDALESSTRFPKVIPRFTCPSRPVGCQRLLTIFLIRPTTFVPQSCTFPALERLSRAGLSIPAYS